MKPYRRPVTMFKSVAGSSSPYKSLEVSLCSVFQSFLPPSTMSSADQPLAHASPHQSPSAFTESQLVANLPEGTQSMIRATELRRLLAHCAVLSPHELLSVAFPKTEEWDITPNDAIKLSFSKKLVSFSFW